MSVIMEGFSSETVWQGLRGGAPRAVPVGSGL